MGAVCGAPERGRQQVSRAPRIRERETLHRFKEALHEGRRLVHGESEDQCDGPASDALGGSGAHGLACVAFQILHAIRFGNRSSLVTYGSPGQAIGLVARQHGLGSIGLASWWARREDWNMSDKSPKELQTMIEELTKRLKVLEQQYVPNVEKRVARLEDDLRSLQRTVASGR
jgi:hypothetical protein